MPSALATTNNKGVPVVSILVGGGHRVARVRTVQELERAGQRGHRGDGDHVRFRAGVAGGAPQGRRWPATVLPDASAEARAARGLLLGQPDHLLGWFRLHLEARLRHGGRPGAVCRGGVAFRHRRAAHGPKRHLDRPLARRSGGHRRAGSLWRRRQQHPAQLGRHRRVIRRTLFPSTHNANSKKHQLRAHFFCGLANIHCSITVRGARS